MAIEFKVGQVVKIRQWDDMEKEFGLDKYEDINIGNRVIFIKSMKHLCGRKTTITSISPNGVVHLDFEDKSGQTDWHYTTDMIEHFIPTYEDLIGKVVETRNGKRYLCIKAEEDGITFFNNSCHLLASDRGADLLSKVDKDFDIMKVYEPKYGKSLNSALNRASTIIWERIEEEKIKEMTVAEIEKLVGSKVKIIKES